jgi:hypothetical protein
MAALSKFVNVIARSTIIAALISLMTKSEIHFTILTTFTFTVTNFVSKHTTI